MADIDVTYCVPASWVNKKSGILNFYLGESKLVTAQVISKEGKDFVLQSAVIRLETLDGEEIPDVINTVPIVDNEKKQISFILTPPEKGLFNLVLSYRIALSTLISKTRVVVK